MVTRWALVRRPSVALPALRGTPPIPGLSQPPFSLGLRSLSASVLPQPLFSVGLQLFKLPTRPEPDVPVFLSSLERTRGFLSPARLAPPFPARRGGGRLFSGGHAPTVLSGRELSSNRHFCLPLFVDMSAVVEKVIVVVVAGAVVGVDICVSIVILVHVCHE